MRDELVQAQKDTFPLISEVFEWTNSSGVKTEVHLKREFDFEVERSSANVFRGMAHEIEGMKNGDTFSSPQYKNGKVLTVMSSQYYGDYAEWVLIQADDIEELS